MANEEQKVDNVDKVEKVENGGQNVQAVQNAGQGQGQNVQNAEAPKKKKDWKEIAMTVYRVASMVGGLFATFRMNRYNRF